MTDAISRFPLQWPQGWPRATMRKRAQFKKSERQHNQGGGSWMAHKALSVGDATARVLQELSRMGVTDGDAVISTNIALRLDGFPRSGQGEPHDPGVAVYWETARRERKVMAIDIYDRVADNLAAVAATLDAMRSIERHGGAQILERAFTGFDALPPPPDPFAILGVTRSATKESVNAAYRAKARLAASDRGNGNMLVELNVARDQCIAILEGRA